MKIRTNLVLSFVGLSLVVALSFTVSQYFSAKGRYEQDLRDKLEIIAHLASLSIDGDLHKTLRNKEDEDGDAYRQIQKILRDVKKSDPDIAFVYTMRKAADDTVIFVVDSTEDIEDFSHLGDVYEEVSPGQTEAFVKKSGTTLEKEFSADKWGTFLSAYGSIVTRDGTFDGIVGVDISIKKYEAAIHNLLLRAAILSIVITIIAVSIAFFLARAIAQPITALTPILQDVAAANLAGKVPYRLLQRKDEIGELSRSVETLKSNLREIVAELTSGAGMLLPSSAGLSSFAGELDANTSLLSSQVLAITSAADQSTGMVKSIATNASEVSESMSGISTALDEMNHSLHEINTNCQKEAAIVGTAESHTLATRALMDRLNASSNEIGKIVKVISEIAAQTNLLALNATIEAARAGESGKGFGVVANEIKVLALQTADSSQQIRDQIVEMQSNTSGAVKAIEEITQLIEQVTESSQIIVAAVHEQGGIIGEISRNMATSSEGAAAIAQHVEDSAQSLSAVLESMNNVNNVAVTTANSVLSVKQSSDDLRGLAVKLEEIVGRFKVA